MKLILLLLSIALIPLSGATSISLYVSSDSPEDVVSVYQNGNFMGNYTKAAGVSMAYPDAGIKKFIPFPANGRIFTNCYANTLNTTVCNPQQWNSTTYTTQFSNLYTPDIYYFRFENDPTTANASNPETRRYEWGDNGSIPEPTITEQINTPRIVDPAIDTITVSHTVSFCRIKPTDSWTDKSEIPATNGCTDTDIFDLNGIPADDLPSGGTSNRIAPSELGIIILRLTDYPSSGTIKYKLENLDTNKLLVNPENNVINVPNCGGNCAWEYWWWQSYFFFGRYSWEVNSTGRYRVSAITSWGTVSYDFTVIDSSQQNTNTNLTYTHKELIPVADSVTNMTDMKLNYNIVANYGTADKTSYRWKLEVYNPANELIMYTYTKIEPAVNNISTMTGQIVFYHPASGWPFKGFYRINMYEIYMPTLRYTRLNTVLIGVINLPPPQPLDPCTNGTTCQPNTTPYIPSPGTTIIGGPGAPPGTGPGTPPIDASQEPIVSGLNKLFSAWIGLLSGLDDTARIIIFIVIVGIMAWKWSTIGAGVGILISAVLGAIPYYIMILMFIVALCALYYKLKQPVRV